MEIIRRTRNIIVKTQRKFIIKQRHDEEVLSCEQCGEPMIMPQTAAVLYDISTRDVFRLVEAGKIHFVETDEKFFFVCSDFGDLPLKSEQLTKPR